MEVLIVENSGVKLQTTKDKSGHVILEGIFAEFGKENRNNRIYEEEQYLPHVKILKEKIENGTLGGELDHPESYNVSLDKISHMILSLEYVKETRQIKGRIKLLDTPAGQTAKKLIEGGYKLSISSRAIGTVDESTKKVNIKQLITYDLVADPGFASAQLNQINESLKGLISNKPYENLKCLNESLGLSSNNLLVFELNKNKINTNMQDNNVELRLSKIESFLEYLTPDLKRQLADLKSSKNNISNNEINKIVEYVKYLAENLDKNIDKVAKHEGYIKYVAENLDKNIGYTEYVAGNLDKNIEYSKYLAENLDKNIEYSKYLAENLDKNIGYSKYIAENLDKNIGYTEYLAENLDKNIGYAKYLAENLDKNIGYAEYLAENIDKNISYTNYVAEHLDKNIGYAEYLAERLDKNIGYTDYLAENIDKNICFSEHVLEQIKNPAARYNNKFDINKLDESVDLLLESALNNEFEMRKNKNSVTPAIIKMISENNRKIYIQLNEEQKQQMDSQFADFFAGKYAGYSADTFFRMVCEQLHHSTDWLTKIPSNYVNIWGSLNDADKKYIAEAAKASQLKTDYQIHEFWNTMLKHKLPADNSLNESLKSTPSTLGVSSDFLAGVASKSQLLINR